MRGLETKSVLARLERVDWNFSGSRTPSSSVHSLHWFPGNFIPQIPSYLIQILSEKDALVLDAFCGSGTSGVEAVLLGRRAWLTDVNHESIHVTRGKLAALNCRGLGEDVGRVARETSFPLLARRRVCHPAGWNCDELSKWFHEETLSQLASIWASIETVGNPTAHDFLTMIFSDTLFACASTSGAVTSGGKRRRHHWGWIADNVLPRRLTPRDATKLFRNRLDRAAEVVGGIELPSMSIVTVRREDIRSLSVPDNSVDLIVTSPPYLGMIDYALASRLSYLWFGWPMEDDRDAEIGARYRRNQKNTVADYLHQMVVVRRQLARVLCPGGYCAVVLGSSRKFPSVALDVLRLFGEELEAIWGPIPRVPTKRRVSERHGTEPKEFLCVYRKPV